MNWKNKCFFGLILIFMLILFLILSQYNNDSDLRNNSARVSKKVDYCIYIQIEDKTLYLLQDGKCIRKYPIASGATYWPSPLGCWKITEKDDWGEGFGGRWLGLNVPWGT